MTTYNITLTDPLKTGFSIRPGAFDGPGGSQTNSTLRLYGRGATEWGEAVDEDLIRLTENFAGATPPHYPISGQLWFQVNYYWHDSSATDLQGWWEYRYSTSTSTWGWTKINSTGVISGTALVNPTIGSFYFNSTSRVLYRWDTAYAQETSSWMIRCFSESNLNGVAPTSAPQQSVKVYDAYSNGGQWVAPVSFAVSLVAPTNPQTGTVWYDLSTGQLKVWNGNSWSTILGPSNGGSQVVSGNLDMNNFSIIHVADSTPAAGNTNAINGESVFNYVSSSLTSLTGSIAAGYLALTGGTVSGNVTIAGTTTLNTVTTSSATINGILNLSGHAISNVANPVNNQDAATKSYVDTAVTGAITTINSTLAGSYAVVTNGNSYSTYTPKDGDIQVVGQVISIYANGVWNQVFPAVYS